ncbi:MAG: nitrate- and nitrite sensing domain-containing protein [Sulfurimonas sp.]|jgi:uncharacterized protein YoxC|nr:nitrate- and nitrite sensing domain-containing protein [Sulfurimonas sp.]
MRIFLIIAILIFNLSAKSLFSNDEQKQSSVYIGSLKNLVIATQKTRGLTNSYMNGNLAAMLLVFKNRGDMKKAIGIMESTDLAADPVINARATTISQSLIKLNNKAFKMKASEAFSNYTEQIEQVLMLAQSVSKRGSKDLNPVGIDASVIMMETMLPMTEYVGRLRGFGSGLAAKGEMNKAELEQVFVLVNNVETLNSDLQKQVIKLTSKYPNKVSSNIDSQLLAVDKASKIYTDFAKDKFLNDIKNIDPNEYFDEGTKLISKIIKAYDTINKALLEDSKGWL